MSPLQSSTNLFRRLSWSSTVPIEISLANSDQKYYLTAPRHSYLALLIPQIRTLLEVALDDLPDESGWWFEIVDDGPFAPVGAVRWHWPIDVVALHASTSKLASKEEPLLRLRMHTSSPPADKLPISAGIESAQTHFVAQVKEADFVRWGNTKRVTSLRRADLEAGWEGVVANDYDLHSRLSSRIVPLPIPQAQEEAGKLESAFATRSLPVKLYLPDGAPAMQHITPPLVDGKPGTLIQMLRAQLPLLFTNDEYTLAQPVILGIVVPPESEVAWLAACMAGADGWLRIGIQLLPK